MTLLVPRPKQDSPDAEAIIKEARLLRVRRRLRYLGVILLLALVTAGGIAIFGGSGGRNGTPTKPSRATPPGATATQQATNNAVSSTTVSALPTSTLITHGSQLWVVTDPNGLPFVGGGDSSTPSTCTIQPVNPSTLALSPEKTDVCNDPALNGGTSAPDVIRTGTNSEALHVVHVDPQTHAIDVGPELATFEPDSGSGVSSAYGPGVLWLYETETVNGPTVWRVSSASGAVLQTISVPDLPQPVLAANDNGLYIAASESYGGPIFRIGIGATHATQVFSAPSIPAGGQMVDLWMVASGSRVWSDVCMRPGIGDVPCTIWGFQGPNLQPVFHSSDKGHIGQQAVLGQSAVYVLSRPGMKEFFSGSLDVLRVDTGTGTSQVVTTVTPVSTFALGEPKAIAIEGKYLFFLDTRLGRLYRMPLNQ